MTDQYRVVGDPIKHSKSPQIHAIFAENTQQNLNYEAQRIAPGDFVRDVEAFFKQGGSGLNITVPFKQEAWSYATQLTERAQLAGAVNTLYLQNGSIVGDTTDGVGLVNDLMNNLGIQLVGQRILLLGAGGAVRGVIQPILQQQPAELVIANRTQAKAEQLAADFAHLGPVSASGFAQLSGPFDVIINGTSASLQGDLPPLPEHLLGPRACCYDMMYGAEPTPFMCWGRDQGAEQVFDGLGMLVEQAAESFFLWRGVRPDTQPVIALIRQQLNPSG